MKVKNPHKFMAEMKKDLKKPPKLTDMPIYLSFYPNNVYKLSKT